MNLIDLPHSSRIAQRFWCKVDKSGDHWLWTGLVWNGYGVLHLHQRGHGTSIRAHRLSYMLEHGELPDDRNVCHTCDIPLCVRPDHLFLGSQADNVHDMMRKGRARLRLGRKGAACVQAKLTNQDVAEMRQRYLAGETQHELARAYGMTQATVRHALIGKSYRDVSVPAVTPRRMGTRDGHQNGSRNPAAKLTEEKVQEMRRRYADGESARSLARHYGVVPQAAWNIVTGRSWKHLP